jgi:hypothetical protein
MRFEIDLDEYRLAVEVTHCLDVKPDYRSWGSADDYYGYREMEFEVISGSVFDEDGNETELGRNGCAGVAEQYAEDIEDRLWTLIEEKREAA